MREYILTPHERQIIHRFLEDGTRLEGFKVLLHRCRKFGDGPIITDSKLIRELLEKTNLK